MMENQTEQETLTPAPVGQEQVMTEEGKEKTKVEPMTDNEVEKVWTDPENKSSFSSLHAFAASTKTNRKLKDLEKSLSRIEAFSRTRPLRKKFPRPAYIIRSPYVGWCTDLVEMENKTSNKGNRYVLVLLDQFSRKAALEPLKKKSKEATLAAIEKATQRLSNGYKNLPQYIISDGGLEYSNSAVRGFFRKHGIEHRVLINHNKASYCERFNRTFESAVYKYLTHNNSKNWLPYLKIFEEKYNNTKHSSTLYPPSSVSEENSGEVFRNMMRKLIKQKRKPARFKIGDRVRIPEKQNVFGKKYKPQFSKRIYKVIKIKPTFPQYSFRVATLNNEEVDKTFSAEELSLVTI